MIKNNWTETGLARQLGDEEWTDTYSDGPPDHVAEMFCTDFVMSGEPPWEVEVHLHDQISRWLVEEKMEKVKRARPR